MYLFDHFSHQTLKNMAVYLKKGNKTYETSFHPSMDMLVTELFIKTLLTMLFSLLLAPSMTSCLVELMSSSSDCKKARHSRTLSKCEVMGVDQLVGGLASVLAV